MSADEYAVGSGIRYEMAQRGDRPAGDEVYLANGHSSLCFGEQYVYLYNPRDGKVRVLDPKVSRRP